MFIDVTEVHGKRMKTETRCQTRGLCIVLTKGGKLYTLTRKCMKEPTEDQGYSSKGCLCRLIEVLMPPLQ